MPVTHPTWLNHCIPNVRCRIDYNRAMGVKFIVIGQGQMVSEVGNTIEKFDLNQQLEIPESVFLDREWSLTNHWEVADRERETYSDLPNQIKDYCERQKNKRIIEKFQSSLSSYWPPFTETESFWLPIMLRIMILIWDQWFSFPQSYFQETDGVS